MAKKQDRFAHKAMKTRRVGGRDVHAPKGESLTAAAEVIQYLRETRPHWDDDFLQELFGSQGESVMALLVRAGATTPTTSDDNRLVEQRRDGGPVGHRRPHVA